MVETTLLNVPATDLKRSVAAQRVGEMASKSELFLYHFEHRLELEAPEHWTVPGLYDVTGARWQGGHLQEQKYRCFRYDNPLGSFHPAQEPKWAAHELAHGLVGFAWRGDASPLFHFCAAQLSELVPVLLWYFLDEDGLQRCPLHEGQGPYYQLQCPRCEERAARGHNRPDGRWNEDFQRYRDGVLAAVAKSRRVGKITGFRYGTLDPLVDALQYTNAHRKRLQSPENARFRELFLGPEQGAVQHLDDLEARVIAVSEAIAGTGPPVTLVGNRALWMAQDVAWRLVTVAAQSDVEVNEAIWAMVSDLADNPSLGGLEHCIEGYESLHDDWIVPEPEAVFATGYRLPRGYGSSLTQLEAGLWQSLPTTMGLLAEEGHERIAAFSHLDTLSREAIGRRFAHFLAAETSGPIADVARFEAAKNFPRPIDISGALTDVDLIDSACLVATSSSLEISAYDIDVRAIVQSWEEGENSVSTDGGEPGVSALEEALNLGICSSRNGEVIIAELSLEESELLRDLLEKPRPLGSLKVPDETLRTLAALGFLRLETFQY